MKDHETKIGKKETELEIRELLARLSTCLERVFHESSIAQEESRALYPTPTYMTRYAFAEMLGVNHPTIINWMNRHWTNGVHYQIVGRITMINVPACMAWLESFQRSNIAMELRNEKPLAAKRKATRIGI